VDHQADSTVVMPEDGFITSFNGNWHKKKTTKEWDICVEWHNGTTSWVLKDVKQSSPLELADYAVANGMAEQPAFSNRIKSKYWRTSHKFGIKIPKSVEHALSIGQDNGTDYW